MAKGGRYITIDTSDIKLLNQMFKDLTEVAKTYFKIDLKAAAIIAETDAKLLAPKNLGQLRNSIKAKETDELTYTLTASTPYAGFVEFGTGGKVDIPKGFEATAAQFKNSGSGTFEEGLEAIKTYCRNKGIDEKYAYPIFISILREGIEPQPYLIPAARYGATKLLEFITKSVKELQKDKLLFKNG